MRKQLGSLVVAAALVFAGCGGGEEPTADQLEQMSDSTTTTSPEDELRAELISDLTQRQGAPAKLAECVADGWLNEFPPEEIRQRFYKSRMEWTPEDVLLNHRLWKDQCGFDMDDWP